MGSTNLQGIRSELQDLYAQHWQQLVAALNIAEVDMGSLGGAIPAKSKSTVGGFSIWLDNAVAWSRFRQQNTLEYCRGRSWAL